MGLTLLAAAILALSVAAFRHYLPYTGPSMAPKEPPAVTLAMRDAYFVGLGSQGKLWSLNAQAVEIGRDRTQTTLTEITDGRIYNGQTPVLSVTAGKAVYNTRTRNLALSKGVRVVGNGGETVAASGAEWDASRSVLISSGKVEFRNEWSDVVTDLLRADLNSKELVMWNVRLTARVDGEDKDAQ